MKYSRVLGVAVFVTLASVVSILASYKMVEDAKVEGNFSYPFGIGLTKTTDSTITEVWEWKALDTPNPYLAIKSTEPAEIHASVVISAKLNGHVRTGMVVAGKVAGPDSYLLDLGQEIGSTTSNSVASPHYSVERNLYYVPVSKITTGSSSTKKIGVYTLTGGGSLILTDPGGGGGFSAQGYTLSYSGGGSSSIPGTPIVAEQKTVTVTKDVDKPQVYECAHVNCNIHLPNEYHHRIPCPHKIPRAFKRGQKDCPGYTWACQSGSVCEHVDDHLKPCAGGCGDELHSSREHVHRRQCTPTSGESVGSYGAGNHYYYNCTQEARNQHARINGHCGHRYRNCVKGDHDQRYTSCSVSLTQNGQTVYCNGAITGWKCGHTHNFPSGSGSGSQNNNGGGASPPNGDQNNNNGGGVGEDTNQNVDPGNGGVPSSNGGCNTPPANGGCTTTPTLVNCDKRYEYSCDVKVSNSYEHLVNCPGCYEGYWTCNSSDVAEHGLRSCTRPRQHGGSPCANQWRRCAHNPYTPNGGIEYFDTAPRCKTSPRYLECSGPVLP